MANPEHLEILTQGVEAWNKWRECEYLETGWLGCVDLSAGDFSGLDLCGANLKEADLRWARLRGTSLCRCNIEGACLSNADLCSADLYGASLMAAKLDEANLLNSNLTETSLVGADLCNAALRSADLHKADLMQAELREADLSLADLSKANLTYADLRGSSLIKSNLAGAILTGVKLYGTARDDWDIRNVKCDWVYWDEEGEQRSPKARDLEPGEFERLYSVLPTIEYIFENGMSPLDPLIMDRVVHALRKRRPDFDLKIDSINARGLAPSIKFTVQHEEHKEPALEAIQKEYEAKISRLETERDHLYNLLGRAIDKAGDVKLISAGPGAIVAMDGSTVNIQQHVHNALDLQKAIAAEPEASESFAKVAKKTALDIVGGAIKDIAKGQVKEAAKQIVELGKDLGPLLVRTAPAAYAFFKNIDM